MAGVPQTNPQSTKGTATGVYRYSTGDNLLSAFGGMDLRAEQKYVVL